VKSFVIQKTTSHEKTWESDVPPPFGSSKCLGIPVSESLFRQRIIVPGKPKKISMGK
jgi:hypothetical protein